VGAGCRSVIAPPIRCVLHRVAVEFRRNRAGVGGILSYAALRRRLRYRRWSISVFAQPREVRAQDGKIFSVITALAPPPHPRLFAAFAQIKQDLGFGVYVPIATPRPARSRRRRGRLDDPILNPPLTTSTPATRSAAAPTSHG